MSDINRTILLGRLGGDPVLRVTKNGLSVATFSLATETYLKTKNETETTWHRVVAWGKYGQRCADELKKGMSVFVEGKTRVRKFQNSEGVTQYFHEIHLEKVHFLHRTGALKRKPEDVTVLEADAADELAAEGSLEELNH